MMNSHLFDYQIKAVENLRTGSILVGGVGSGKSRVGLKYYCQNYYPKKLYIITTAKKRDGREWEKECRSFVTIEDPVIDSWNNIHKYTQIKDAFFIFDEQRLVGSGVWVKSFLKIAKSNSWILLSATPGDTWMDYIPVFIANGFYRNRTEFIRRHVVYNNFAKFPKVDHYVGTAHLNHLRSCITVNMEYKKRTVSHDSWVPVAFDQELFNTVFIKRWNPFEHKPIKAIGEFFYLMRRVVNADPRRLGTVQQLLELHPRAIVFYNFNYELELLLGLASRLDISVAQWNGHKHENLPEGDRWVYLVQYTAGAEGWECVETNVVIFYSLNYSYKINVQAAGRVDRLNTLYEDLFYYHLYSRSYIDLAIRRALRQKRSFNEKRGLNMSSFSSRD